MEQHLHDINIGAFFRVIILDSDPVFCDRLKVLLDIIGVTNVNSVQSAATFASLVETRDCDLAFVEIADDFEDVWAEIGCLRDRGVMIVGVSDDRSGRDWISAVRRGADTILLKPYYPHLLREMMRNLVESPAARRCRVVQFPARRQLT